MKTDTIRMRQIKEILSARAVRQIAELAGVSRSTVYSVLGGKRKNLAVYDVILLVLEEEISASRKLEEKADKLLSLELEQSHLKKQD